MARILFVQNFWFEYLGTMVLSAVLKRAGHEVDLIIQSDSGKVLAELPRYQPDIIAAYVVSGSHEWVLNLFRKIKLQTDVLTIMGGPHPTFFPEIVEEDGVDIICRGEGEDALLELAQCVDSGTEFAGIQNLWVRQNGTVKKNTLRPLIEDLDSLPVPDRELYYKYPVLRDSPSKHFITGRGCPFNCSFCSNKAYKEIYAGLGAMVRKPDIAKICKEIRDVREKYPLKAVRFDDEVFLLKESWLLEFLDCYSKEVNLPFSCLIRADLTTEKMVAAMHRAGCYIAYFGIESGNDRIRNDVLGKNISREEIQETARLLKKFGIKIGTFNMVGMPGETFENAWETVELNQQIQADYPWCSIIQPYPGTDLEKLAKKMKLLDSTYSVHHLTQSYFNDTVIENADARALVSLQKLFYLAVRFPRFSHVIKKIARRGTNNFLTRWLFNITYAYRYSKTYRMPMFSLLKRAILWKDNY